jgi:uncharacterized repeat protein (TIGR04076 family)
MARKITVKVTAVRGICNAELKPGDLFLLEGLQITPQGHGRACFIAFASIIANVGRLKLQPQGLFISCPDPGTGQGGNVQFEVNWTDYYEHHQD